MKSKRIVARSFLVLFGFAMLIGGAMLTPAGVGTETIHMVYAGLGLGAGGCLLWEGFTGRSGLFL